LLFKFIALLILFSFELHAQDIKRNEYNKIMASCTDIDSFIKHAEFDTKINQTKI